MREDELFPIIFTNISLYISCSLICCLTIYLTIRKIAIAGILDPLHFYLTFTFGTAYGIILGLYFEGHINNYYAYTIFLYGLAFYISLILFSSKLRTYKYYFYCVKKSINARNVYLLTFGLYIILIIVIFTTSGAGTLTNTNRFEQNRGFGQFVRILNCIKPFIISVIFLSIIQNHRLYRKNLYSIIYFIILALIVILNSFIEGAKFSILNAFYVLIVAYSIRYKKPKFNFLLISSVLIISFVFSLFVLNSNLEKNGVDMSSQDTMFLKNGSVLQEKFLFRIIANADKYYFGLPGGVIDKIDADNLFIRMIEPIIGVTTASKIFGYETNEFNVGRQLTKYHYPQYDVSGGATSHFDLFCYKYLGLFFGVFGVILISFLISVIINISNVSKTMLWSCFIAGLYNNSLPVLLEPCTGLAYMLDYIIVFFVIFFLSSKIIKRI